MADGSSSSVSATAGRFVQTRFGRVRCVVPAADPALPAALLVHGVGARAEVWEPMLPLLRNVQAIAIDLPGHGESTGPLLSIHEAAQCLDDVRIVLGMHAVIAIGQSLGGAVVQRYARDFAPACRGIVIAHSAAHFAIAEERIRQVLDDWPAAAREFAARQVSSRANEVLKQEALRLVSLRDPAVLAHDLRACNAFDARPWAAGVHAPVLVVAGDEDAAYGPRRARELQSLYAGSQVVVLPSCAHNAVLEQPAAFAAVIDAFVLST